MCAARASDDTFSLGGPRCKAFTAASQRASGTAPVNEARKVQDFFQHEWIVVRELDRATAEAAREVVWNNSVKPKDAIHVATALLVHGQTPLDQLDTYDDDLLPLSETFGIPPLKIGHPEIPGKLF
jgi:predicted nucleic acid-binding protein